MLERRENPEHYDKVVEAWRFILGEDFHVGYFDPRGSGNLTQATAKLIDRLAEWGGAVGRDASVLDVGCGIGGAARHLHQRFGCRVTGITVTERERSRAEQITLKSGMAKSVEFHLAQATDNGLPDESFDLVWQLESSHLMPDKRSLFRENLRVLKRGGRLILCDFTLRRPSSIADLFHYSAELKAIESAFGRVKNETLAFYEEVLVDSGYAGVGTLDVTEAVRDTAACWRANLDQNREEILRVWGAGEIDEFRSACDAVETLFEVGLLGYGFVRARKSG